MRPLLIPLICLALLSHSLAQDAPASPAPAQAFKQIVYKNTANSSTITLTGPDALVLEIDGIQRPGSYTVKDGAMHVLLAAAGSRPAANVDFAMPSDGVLVDGEHNERFETEAVLAKADALARSKPLAQQCLSNAKQIGLACRLYASDNDGKYPPKLEDLIPTYLQDKNLFVSPLSANKEEMGFEYLGAGLTDSDDPTKILLRSKDTTPDGLRVVVFLDSSGKIVPDKSDKGDKPGATGK
ncbi:MAG TPA: hypothetical protein VG733_04270 [Chthoniobacteraceae bacterium]|nr:hypothetical protein [Chthoniobacteraceae bacterium]